jgi:TonB family protein
MSPLGRVTAIAAALALASFGIAAAQTRIDRRPSPPRTVPTGERVAPTEVIETPIWTQRAVQEDIIRVYPPEAREAKLQGAAQLTCEAKPGGRVQSCVVAGEAPAGAGFGEAALKLTGRYRMASFDADRNPVGGRKVNFQVVFAPGLAYQPFAADPGRGQNQVDAGVLGGR